MRRRCRARPSMPRWKRCATGEADLAIMPVENSVYGRIADIHLLVRHFGRPVKGYASAEKNDLFIAGEHFHRVRHQLLGLKGAKLADVKEVYSQGPALGQCRKIIKELEADRARMVRHRGLREARRRTEGSELPPPSRRRWRASSTDSKSCAPMSRTSRTT